MEEQQFFALNMVVPLGTRHGMLSLRREDGVLSGTLEMFEKSSPIHAGHQCGQTISFSGTLQTPLYLLPYQAQGIIKGDHIRLCLRTEKGTFEASGERINGIRGEHSHGT